MYSPPLQVTGIVTCPSSDSGVALGCSGGASSDASAVLSWEDYFNLESSFYA